jgi:lysozyme
MFSPFLKLVLLLLFFSLSILSQNGVAQDFESKFILGIDISKNAESIDFEEAYQRGIRFVFIKKSFGGMYTTDINGDTVMEKNFNFFDSVWKIIPPEIYKGPYHYWLNNVCGQDQAEVFLNSLSLDENSLPPVLDLEDAINSPSFVCGDLETLDENILIWIDLVETKLKRKVLIYTGPWGIWEKYTDVNRDQHLNTETLERLRKKDLWVCDIFPENIMKQTPDTLGWSNWTFWQFAQNVGRSVRNRSYVKDGAIDVDIFNGTVDDLRIFIENSKIP